MDTKVVKIGKMEQKVKIITNHVLLQFRAKIPKNYLTQIPGS